jgi:macrolide transport system ATP-binding/permease protein
MPDLRGTLWRLRAMFRRERLMTEKREEMQQHLDMEIAAGIRRGLSLDEATRHARLRIGHVADAIEPTREAHGIRWLDGAWGDLRHAFRALTRNPGFGTVTILVLAASVAINTLIFFMLDGVVLRPLPYAAPERLVRLYDAGKTQPKFPVSIGHYLEYREHATSIESIALYTGRDMEWSGNDARPQQLTGLQITTDYFKVLGRPLHLGHAFTDADLDTEIPHVVISHRLWRDSFQSDPAIVGKTIRLNRQAWTIIGVAGEGFQHVGGAYRSPMQGETVDIWLPLTVQGERPRRAYHFTNAIARLRDGVTETQAQQELQQLASQYQKQFADYGTWGLRMEPLAGEVAGTSRQIIVLLMAAGGLVMLVACANIAGLCVARAVARRKELALRHALGANRWQLLRVGLAENLLIGIAGGALGLLLAGLGLPLLRQLLPADFPRAHEIGLTAAAAIFATSVGLATVLLAGLLPAGRSQTLESQTRVTGGRDSRRLRTALVVGEIALAGFLCAGALFLLRSYQEIGARDHGFEASNTLTFQISAPFSRNGKDDFRIARLQEDVRRNIAAIPGVAAVGASTNLPWSGYDENAGFTIVGRTAQDNSGDVGARYQAATAGYFEATGMHLVSGRLFEATRDVHGQQETLLINDALATKYFPRGDAVGTIVDVFGDKRQIVGVVKGITDYPADLDIKPAFWFPLGQAQFGIVFFAVRSNGVDVTSLTSAVTAAVHAVDPDLPVADIRTLQKRADSALASRRFALWLFQAFAGLALILAAAGIYGLLAYVVRQRRKELGIRAALGASRADLGKMVLKDGLKMATAGAVACLLLIPIGGSLLQAFLYNVRAFDLFTMIGAPAALLTVAALASLGPARSATRSDPSLALRED